MTDAYSQIWDEASQSYIGSDGAERVHTGQLRDESISSPDLEVKAAIERLKEAAERATDGPWKHEEGTEVVWGACDPDNHTSYGMGVPVIAARIETPHWARDIPRYQLGYEQATFNAAYIALANPSTILSLISSYEERGREIERLRSELEIIAGGTDGCDQLLLHPPVCKRKHRAQAALSQAHDMIASLEGEISRLEDDGVRQIKEVITLRRVRGPGIARLMAAPAVLIQSDNGWWRANGCGYTDQSRAAVYTGADAYRRTKHCGPEKAVRYHVLARALLSTPKGSDEA